MKLPSVQLLEGKQRAEAVEFAQANLSEGNNPISVIKAIREKTNCSLTAAKDIYIQAQYGIPLEQYQEELFSDLKDVPDNLEKADPNQY